MSKLFDPRSLHQAILNRMLERKGESLVIELLIDRAELYFSLLKMTVGQQASFNLSLPLMEDQEIPNIDRLTLVYPQSFAFDWKIRVSGYFDLKYSAFSRPLPHPVESIELVYSGIITLENDSIRFKSEQVELI